jgi:regulator of RNase E activity RraA
MRRLSEATRRLLAEASTATLTTQLFKRGLRNTFMQGVRRLTPDAPVMIGEAYTLRMIPAREDLDHRACSRAARTRSDARSRNARRARSW